MNITVHSKSDLSEAENSALGALNSAVYSPADVANWPGRAIEWSPRLMSVIVWNGDRSQAITHAGIVLRDGLCNGNAVKIGGIGGVMTHPSFRRQGFGASAIRRCIEFFREQGDINFALLVCENRLIPFYEHLGWHLFPGELLVRQQGQPVAFTFNLPMTFAIQSPGELSGVIDLGGPPW